MRLLRHGRLCSFQMLPRSPCSKRGLLPGSAYTALLLFMVSRVALDRMCRRHGCKRHVVHFVARDVPPPCAQCRQLTPGFAQLTPRRAPRRLHQPPAGVHTTAADNEMRGCASDSADSKKRPGLCLHGVPVK